VIRRNHMAKPLSWRGVWMCKNLLELKNARRVSIDGNVFEYSWSSGQAGEAIMITPRNQEGTNPWATVEDVTFTNNTIRHAARAFNILGTDNLYPSQMTKRITIRNNVFEDISAYWSATGQSRFMLITETASVTVDHNTIFNSHSILVGYENSSTNFSYTNNISAYGEGIIGATGLGSAALAQYFPGAAVTANVMMGGNAGFWDGAASRYPQGTFFPSTWAEVGFVNYNGGLGGDYRLAASSPYKNAGTDGRDLGADIDQLRAAQGGTIPAQPLPSPTPTIVPVPTPTPTPASWGSLVTFGGVVRDEDGTPAGGRVVQLLDDQGVIYSHTLTAADGTYRFTGAAGDYFIRPDPWAGYSYMPANRVIHVSYDRTDLDFTSCRAP